MFFFVHFCSCSERLFLCNTNLLYSLCFLPLFFIIFCWLFVLVFLFFLFICGFPSFFLVSLFFQFSFEAALLVSLVFLLLPFFFPLLYRLILLVPFFCGVLVSVHCALFSSFSVSCFVGSLIIVVFFFALVLVFSLFSLFTRSMFVGFRI